MSFHQRDFRSQASRTGCCDQPTRAGADNDQIVTTPGGGISPMLRMDTGNEARIVRVRRRNQKSFQISAHDFRVFWSRSLGLILLASAFFANRVTKTVTVIVASRPTPYNTHSPVVRRRCPAPRFTNEPR